MTKKEAAEAMRQGKRITHPNFAHSEWISSSKDGDIILLGNGMLVFDGKLWSFHRGCSWEDGYQEYVDMTTSSSVEEYILCAAIHFKDDKHYEHQPKNIESGFVVCGRRHSNCYATLTALGTALGLTDRVRQLIGVIGRDNQGFVTNTNRYVERREGYRIAKAAGQLLLPTVHGEDDSDAILTSEDLY